MVAKAIMILFPVGVILTLGYISVHFFSLVPKETVPVEPVVAQNLTPLVIPDYATDSPESEFIAQITSSSTEVATTTSPVIVEMKPKVELMIKPVSPSLLRSGLYGDGWVSNSWGASIALEKKTASLGVFFHNAWEALSLYSTGYTPKAYRSVEIALSSTSLDPHSLFISAYNGNKRLGGVPLYPYTVNETGKIYRIPLEDIMGTSTRVTQFTIESDRPQVVFFSEIAFSKLVEQSRLEEIRDKEKVIPPAVVPTPEVILVPTEPAVLPKIRSAATTNANVYFGGLQSGWKTVARRGAVIDTLEDENQSVTGKAIKMHFTKQDGSIAFEREGGIATKNFVNLHLKVYAGMTDYQWQQLIVTLYDIDGNKLGSRDIMTYSGNGKLLMQNWNKAILPLREFGASDTIIGTIEIENVSVTQEGDFMWIDDVRFLDENS